MIEGGCACGATRYVLDDAPRDLEDCHCEDCRRSAGGPFVTWGSVDRVKFRIVSGQLQRVRLSGRFRHFASCCGSLILFEQRTDALSIEVAIATLDDPAPYAPTRIIWVEDRLPWVPLDSRLPQYPRNYQPVSANRPKRGAVG